MSRLTLPARPQSRASIATSDTTYHSFLDSELEEPTVVPPPCPTSAPPRLDLPPLQYEIRRQDSGYQSLTPADSGLSRRRSSPTWAPLFQHHRQQPRPRRAVRRTPKPAPVAHVPRSRGHSLDNPFRNSTRSQRSYPTSPDASIFVDIPHLPLDEEDGSSAAVPTPAAMYSHPPQTTHYWTSDRTRRLEYAAIDAASRGIRGWVMRHLVPDCVIPEGSRRVRFEDDRGSVVRYRLDLDGGVEKDGEAEEGWGVRKKEAFGRVGGGVGKDGGQASGAPSDPVLVKTWMMGL